MLSSGGSAFQNPSCRLAPSHSSSLGICTRHIISHLERILVVTIEGEERIRLPVSHVRLNTTQHVDCCLVHLKEHTIEDLHTCVHTS